jgi:hypothetical protein
MNPMLAFERVKAIDFWRDDRIAMVSGACLIVLLTTLSYFPALVLHETLANGDLLNIDWPFFDFFARVIKGQASPLWSAQIWGGHPLFAEAQGGFAHPLNIIWAAIVTLVVGPIYSMNLFYWLLKIGGGIGVMGLCRTLGASFWSSTFAALAVVFSQTWVDQQHVLPVYHTMTWIPWCLWAMEVWLKRPTFGSTALLGSASALVSLAGYPQGLHGTMIYAFATLLIAPFQADIRREWAKSWRKRAMLALVGFAIGVGLCAVQLFPLLELVGLSHRNAGIDIIFAGLTPLSSYLRGLLVTDYTSNAGTGSLLVGILVSCTLLFSIPDRVKGHMLAALILLVLGWERATPIFGFLYDHHLVPGLGYFRAMGLYIAIASIGIAVSAAFAIDRLSEWKFQPRKEFPNARSLLTSYASYARYPLLLTAFWILALLSLRFDWKLAAHVALAIAAGAALVGLVKNRRPYLIAPVFTLVLTVEIFALRLYPFQFFPNTIFAKPPEVAAIQAVPDWREFKMMTDILFGVVAFIPPHSPELPIRIRIAVAAIAPMTNTLWDLPSMNGYLALALKRRTAIEDTLHDEIFGTVRTRPGLRLIDILGVRFITNGGELGTTGFRTLYVDQRPEIQVTIERMYLLENETALPRFQLYSRYEAVDTLEAAISAVKSMKMRKLVIENPDQRPMQLSASDSISESYESAHMEVLKATDTEYRLKVSTTKPQWLFLADANYPGWTAKLDGRNVPVFSAQVLGKAIEIPPGDHDVILRFKSMTFYIGLLISMFTLTIVVFGAVFILIRGCFTPS